MHALIATDLRKGYTSGKVRTEILRGLSLSIDSGKLTLISGPSGCGKSTLLSILSGLQRPDAGSVIALGEDLWRGDKRALDRFRLAHTGFVFQGFNLFPALTALEQVMLPLGYLAIDDAEAARRSRIALEEVGLAARMQLRPAELSGGEKQRVCVARAMMNDPEVIFADEPTASLDHANGHLVVDLLSAYKDRGTVIVVTHDPE
ncbi:MAG: ABC transporter ATP-binding protein, partial [Pseudomonadota bacterium]|nr:ABC transporter ATP-binding protein [Pseudomonadota bacterium]